MEKTYYTEMESPVGLLLISANETALTHVIWSSSSEATLLKKNAVRKRTALLNNASKQLNEYFHGKRKSFDLPLNPGGTTFQKKVWKTLEKIPYGHVWSYKDQAQKMGAVRAMRAVGGANGRNPISIIVPCHRVIGANGRLTGYGGGLGKKKILLELEGLAVKGEKVL